MWEEIDSIAFELLKHGHNGNNSLPAGSGILSNDDLIVDAYKLAEAFLEAKKYRQENKGE